MDEIRQLRADVTALRNEIASLKRQPERRQAQVEAVVPVLRKILVAMGVEERVAQRWQEELIAADDPDRRQMANLDLFHQLDSAVESRRTWDEELGQLLAREMEARARSAGTPTP